jgi:hypothetical protein
MILLIVAFVIFIVLATQVRRWYAVVAILQQSAGMLEALNIQAVTKVLIATMQIIGGLTAVLHLRFPDSFRRVMAAIASVFRFDIAISLGIGCLTDGTYIPSLLANFGMVALVVLVGGGAYVYESRKLQRDIDSADDDGH